MDSGWKRFDAGELTVPRAIGGCVDEQNYSMFQISLEIERLGELIF